MQSVRKTKISNWRKKKAASNLNNGCGRRIKRIKNIKRLRYNLRVRWRRYGYRYKKK